MIVLSAEIETSWSLAGRDWRSFCRNSASSFIFVSFQYRPIDPSVSFFSEIFSGNCSDEGSNAAEVCGRSTLIGVEPMIAGTVIMNTIKSTSTTSTIGVTLMSLITRPSSSSPKETAAAIASTQEFGKGQSHHFRRLWDLASAAAVLGRMDIGQDQVSQRIHLVHRGSHLPQEVIVCHHRWNRDE